MWKRVAVFSLTFLLIFPFLFSQEAENKISKALDELKKGNTEKVIELLSEAIMELTNKMDFQVKEMIICSEVRGYRNNSSRNRPDRRKSTLCANPPGRSCAGESLFPSES